MMSLRDLGRVTAAESLKLLTLPVAVLSMAGTVLIGVLLTAALAATPVTGWTNAVAVVVRAVVFVQAGMVLLGVLPAAHEYAGRQIRTSLTSVPDRLLLGVGKTIVTLATATVTATMTVGAGLVAASTILGWASTEPITGADLCRAAGAVVYLVLVALLSHAIALLTRALIPALVGMLTLVLVVSPLVSGLSEHTRWLPDLAGRHLYGAMDPGLTATAGGLVMCAWCVVLTVAGIVSLKRRDA